ncbi:MarR family winged helix-turn-helix transcriptional regulator [Jeotgalibacillus terrae]|uniref:MarR family winged helix-turn-helix transcriptional regulator n=1 Tax=Jeotgalibacillus terrae TaxID=587735 RepID=A0ABW5ZKI4_9BACL|nr:MarR family transcriptional regulator [Jeotgalibacillus terrae]MBM7578051.1 DNA-binding MarR family transcriptional regulator [Jeotgalibacillus terrae]
MYKEKDEHIGIYTSHTIKAIIRFLTTELKQFDITPEQWIVLKRLAANDGITQKELAVLADKDRPSITRILDILEQKELARKEKHHTDRRSFSVFITPRGIELKNQLLPFLEDVYEDRILKDITDEELEVYRRVLEKMNRNIEGV